MSFVKIVAWDLEVNDHLRSAVFDPEDDFSFFLCLELKINQAEGTEIFKVQVCSKSNLANSKSVYFKNLIVPNNRFKPSQIILAIQNFFQTELYLEGREVDQTLNELFVSEFTKMLQYKLDQCILSSIR